MTLFDMTILNLLFLMISLCLASIFQIYGQSFINKKNCLYFDLALITSFYFILKYGSLVYYELTVLFLNIPILIAGLKKRNYTFVGMILFILSIYNIYYSNIIYYLILEYIIYIIVYFALSRKETDLKVQNKYFFLFFCISKTLSTIIFTRNILEILAFYIVTMIIINFSKKMEDFLQATFTVKQLEEEKHIRTSLFKITHEIKNPIAVCNGYLQMFDVNKLEHSRSYIPIIRDEIDKVLTLLEDFLSITKIKLNKDIVDIYYLLEEVTGHLKPILKENNIHCNFVIPDAETYIEADYNRLNQVFLNLLKNSIESIEGMGDIELYTKETRDYIYIYLTDNGTGISKENLKKMNEPFFTTKKKGTGLGVFLSREIIKLHHGDISYRSILGKGTTVQVKLPLKKDINYS